MSWLHDTIGTLITCNTWDETTTLEKIIIIILKNVHRVEGHGPNQYRPSNEDGFDSTHGCPIILNQV